VTVSLRRWVKRLEREARGEAIEIRQRDGSVKWFYDDDYIECFLHEYERGRRHFDGEDPGPAHPIVEALRDAAEGEVERLVPTQGTMILAWLGADEILRGERERSGPPVVETSPGVYE
jgi:hypothetical protein